MLVKIINWNVLIMFSLTTPVFKICAETKVSVNSVEVGPIFMMRIPRIWYAIKSLRWRHNGCDSVSNHQPRECLLRRLIRHTSKKTPKLRVTGLCAGNSPVTGEFPAQLASNAETVSIWWRHHVLGIVMIKNKIGFHSLQCIQWLYRIMPQVTTFRSINSLRPSDAYMRR